METTDRHSRLMKVIEEEAQQYTGSARDYYIRMAEAFLNAEEAYRDYNVAKLRKRGTGWHWQRYQREMEYGREWRKHFKKAIADQQRKKEEAAHRAAYSRYW